MNMKSSQANQYVDGIYRPSASIMITQADGCIPPMHELNYALKYRIAENKQTSVV